MTWWPFSTALSAAVGGSIDPLFEAADMAVQRRRTRAEHVDRLRAEIGSLPLLFVPELFTRTHGMRATTQVAAALEAEL